jgi:spermidine/putrescine transport system ATP-binding protein
MAETIVQLDAVSKSYGPVRAVARVSLAIGRGEFVSLLGPSGCGKSTILRIIAGFESPDEGGITIDGIDMTVVPPHQRPVNTVFQSYALFPHLTVFDNVAFGLRRKRAPRDELRTQSDHYIRLVGLEGLEGRYPAQLSGGQQQRVALARALANKPKLLLLDEPLAALDLKLRKRMQIELKQLQRELGISFLYVTHDQEEALALSDRIAVMDGGRVLQYGTGRELYDHPASEFVANFLGESNVLDCRASHCHGGDLVAELEGQRFNVAGLERPSKLASDRIRISVRPEHFSVLDQPPNSGNFLKSQLVDKVFLGSSYLLVLRVGDVVTINARSFDRALFEQLALGQEVYASWRPEQAVLVAE